MITNHTPDPWSIEQGNTEDDLIVCSKKGDFICAPSGATLGEAIDNARLIAAAPDLLTHLARVVSQFNALENNLSEADILVIGEAKAAIAKATGKESV